MKRSFVSVFNVAVIWSVMVVRSIAIRQFERIKTKKFSGALSHRPYQLLQIYLGFFPYWLIRN
jgi:hypothetical protein